MRLIQLDILRALAIILVLGAHLPPSIMMVVDTPMNSFLLLWQKCGWTGVDLFFVLSGFLVSGLLFREYKEYGTVQLGRFFIRRGLKIYPAFYVFMLLTPVMMKTLELGNPSFLQYFCEVFYIQNYGPNIWEHTWSLAIEEHFYLFIGLLIALRVKSSDTEPLRIFILLSLVCGLSIMLFRVVNFITVLYSHKTHMFPTHLRIDSLLFGVLLAYLHHFKYDKVKPYVQKHKYMICIISMLFIVFSLFWGLGTMAMMTFGLTTLYCGFGGLLILSVYCCDEEKIKASKLNNLVARIGVYSYSIYLWHIPVSKAIALLMIRNFSKDVTILHLFVYLFLYVAGSVILGIVMAKMIEMPVLQLRDKIFPSRSQKLQT